MAAVTRVAANLEHQQSGIKCQDLDNLDVWRSTHTDSACKEPMFSGNRPAPMADNGA